jgi:hypothetical protein
LTSSVEWGETDDHLVGKDAESPPIYWECMASLLKNLRCEVFRRSAETVGLLILLQDLSQAKISEADVPVLTHQDIFWLEISINNFLCMKMA